MVLNRSNTNCLIENKKPLVDCFHIYFCYPNLDSAGIDVYKLKELNCY